MKNFRLERLRALLGCVATMLWLGLCFLRPQLQAGPAGPVTWGSTFNVAPGGWGRMIQLTNGNWLCVSTRFPSGTNSYLGIYRSTDNCRTWSYLAAVAESARTLDNGELVALPNGQLLLTMRSLVEGSSYRLPVYRSTDNGQNWAYLSNIDTSEGLGSRGLWEPDFQVLADGRLAVTYSNEKHNGYSQMISEKISADDGATWGTELWAVAQPGGGSLRPGMSQMARMGDGRYILVYEIVGLGNADVYCKFSSDGVAWPTDLGRHIPCQHCGPFVTSLPDGRLLITSCENQVSFSDDYGQTWQRIDPPALTTGFKFTWPAVYSIRSNEVGVLAINPSAKLRLGNLAAPLLWPNLFIDRFDTGTDTNWTQYGGNFGFDQGRYLLNNTNTYGKALTGDAYWTDGVLDADVMVATPGDAGIMFRVTNPDYVGPDDALGYYAGLNTAGQAVLGRMSNSWTVLATAPMAVPTNTWHHIRLVLKGSQFTFYVDNPGQPKITYTDSSFLRGQVGVRSYQCNAQFDNVSFSNAVPMRLDIQLIAGQLRFSWPESGLNLKLWQRSTLGPGNWGLLTNPAALTNGRWGLSLPLPGSTAEFYRLQ